MSNRLQKFGLKIYPRIRKTLAASLVLIIVLGTFWFVTTLQFTSWDFRNNLWGPSHLLVNGHSPYRIDLLFNDSNAVWFPMAIGFLFPIGCLTEYQATNIWFLSHIMALIALAWISLEHGKPTLISLALSILMIFLFPPTLSHLKLGQFTIFASLIFLLTSFYLKKIPKYILSLFLAVSLSKPQLGILILPGLLIANWRMNGTKDTIRFIAWLFAWMIWLTIPLFVAEPLWFNDFLTAQAKNPSWIQPSLFHLLQVELGKTGLILWAGIALIVFGVNTWLWFYRPSQKVIFWSLAFTPLITPYVWSWDYVMLLPLLIKYTFGFKSKVARLWLGFGYLLCWVFIVQIDLKDALVSNHHYWWVAWLLMGFVGSGYIINKKLRPNSSLKPTNGAGMGGQISIQ